MSPSSENTSSNHVVFAVTSQFQMITKFDIGFGILGIFQSQKGFLASTKGLIDQVDQVASQIQGSTHKDGMLSLRISQLVIIEQVIDTGYKLLLKAPF